MAIGAAIGGIAGGLIQSRSADKATKAQTRAANNELALQRQIYDETSANFSPYREGGLNAFNAIQSEMGLGEAPEGYGGFQATPGYQFAVDQGTRALEGSAAAGGNLRSGATMKALQNYGQGMANQEYGNYMSRLGTLANMGQAAAGNQAAAGANFAAGAGNAMQNIGNAQSAGAIAQGNAWSGGINNALGAYQMAQMAGTGGGGLTIGGAGSLFGNNSWG